MSKKSLTIKDLIQSANEFCEEETKFKNRELFGITDGKAVGTYIEHKFKKYLNINYIVDDGSSARGVDFQLQTSIQI